MVRSTAAPRDTCIGYIDHENTMVLVPDLSSECTYRRGARLILIAQSPAEVSKTHIRVPVTARRDVIRSIPATPVPPLDLPIVRNNPLVIDT